MRDLTRGEIEKFLDYLLIEKGYSLNTIECYKTDLMELYDFLEDKPVHDINEKDIKCFLGSLVRYGFKRSSILRKLSALRSFFEFLLQEGGISQNPCEDIRITKDYSKE